MNYGTLSKNNCGQQRVSAITTEFPIGNSAILINLVASAEKY